MNFVYRVHAIERMFQRDITETEAEEAVKSGEVIELYEDDKPYPSYLAVKYFVKKTIHVVFAKENEENTIIITAYEPSLEKWQEDMKTRRV